MSENEMVRQMALALISAYQDKTGKLSKETLEEIKKKYDYTIKE